MGFKQDIFQLDFVSIKMNGENIRIKREEIFEELLKPLGQIKMGNGTYEVKATFSIENQQSLEPGTFYKKKHKPEAVNCAMPRQIFHNLEIKEIKELEKEKFKAHKFCKEYNIFFDEAVKEKNNG